MNCRRAQTAISERMDGEHLSSRVAHALDRHLASCQHCNAFVRSAERLRQSVRIGPALEVPDLVGSIMAAVAREAETAVCEAHTLVPGRETAPERAPARRTRPIERPVPIRRARQRPPLWPRVARQLAPVAAALVVGSVVGSLVVGGPWRRPAQQQVAIADVTRGVATAAKRLDAYRARFAVTEWNFAPRVPVREHTLSVWFHAPERFRLDVADHTIYPHRDWTPNDLSLVVNRSRWGLAEPSACPPGVASCPSVRTVVRNRAPFSASTPVPTDLMVPVDTLSGGHHVVVLGETTIDGRPAVKVELPFQRATPLFPFLQMGSWRPFFSSDRVVLWLDASSWFPLRSVVYPSTAPARDAWELRFGLPDEKPGDPILDVTALSVDGRVPPHGTFAVPREKGATDEGARPVPLEELAAETGLDLPPNVEGLELYRAAVAPVADGADASQTIVTYSEGLTWLKIGETRDWHGDAPYGPIGPQAEEIRLPGGGVAYYEPSTEDLGRRVAVHTTEAELYLETNLSRDQLIEITSELPVQGEPFPEAWWVRRSGDTVTERVSLERAQEAVRFPILLPQELPSGYVFASVELVTLGDSRSVNVFFRQSDTDLGSGPIRLHLEAAAGLPPATATEQSEVQVRGATGRWNADAHRLEWVEDGVYLSLDSGQLTLEDLVALADSLAPVASPSEQASPSASTTAAAPSSAPPEPEA